MGADLGDGLPNGTYQMSETITATAQGDETLPELRELVASRLPRSFVYRGGLERIRKGDPVLGSPGRFHDHDRQAHVAFVAHHPRIPLSAARRPTSDLSEVVAVLRGLLIRHQEERRLVRMKDCDAVYDITLAMDTEIALAKLEGAS